ncbi:MAG: uracil-DNA glycosylase family protein [Haloferacaceae archaeon]
MRNVTDRISNPFAMSPPCERYVPGYGDANADFHVVGDSPDVHGGDDAATADGGASTADGGTEPETATGADATGGAAVTEDGAGVPFTNAAGLRLQEALADADLLSAAGPRPSTNRTFLSYLDMCVRERAPTDAEYREMERFFDAELRAIAAHVLLPVGERAIRHVLENYTARSLQVAGRQDRLHGTELLGSGFLVLPIKEPAAWTDGDADRLVGAIEDLRSTDYRRESDLGRFFAGDDPYYVR